MHSFSGSFRSFALVEPDVPVGMGRNGRGARTERDEDIAFHRRSGRPHRHANRSPSGRRRLPSDVSTGYSGFTLLEILLTLALIGLLAAVLVGGGARLLQNKAVTPDDVFWNAVQEARKMALKSDQEVTLKFVEDKDAGKGFAVTQGDSTRLFAIPSAPRDLEISFLSPQKSGNLILVAGTVLETQPISAVTFYPDGTCTAFKVQFYQGGGTHLLSVDPWTCAPMLTAADANASSTPKS